MPAVDRYASYSGSATGSAVSLRAVTPNDNVDLDFVSNGLLIGGSGTISVIARDDADPVSLVVVAGQILPIRARRVRLSGTTATDIVALIS